MSPADIIYFFFFFRIGDKRWVLNIIICMIISDHSFSSLLQFFYIIRACHPFLPGF